MQTNKADQLNGIVSALSAYIDIVRGYDLSETADLLRMAKLDLQMRIHGISNQELQALCDVLETGPTVSAPAAANCGEIADGLSRDYPSAALRVASTADDILLRPRLHPDGLRRRQNKRMKPM